MLTTDLLAILPLVSAILWFGIGLWPFVRYRFASPFLRSLTIFALLVGAWSLLDWYFLTLKDPAQADLAVLVSNVRMSVLTFAILALVLASKWLYFGHSRYDVLLVLPVLGSLAIIWTGLASGVEQASWGLRLVRDPVRYSWWAAQQVAYVSVSIVITVALYIERKDLESRLRLRILATTGSLFIFLGTWLATNIYNNVTQTAGVPWFSTLLVVPAVIVIAALVPLSPEDLGRVFRALSDVRKRVIAAYLFYRSGEPLVALSSRLSYPIEPEQLEGVLAVVGNFVETSVPASRGYDVTAMRYDQLGILAVRGERVIVAVVYDGPAYDALRSELVRLVRDLEVRRAGDLQTWEDATRVAESVADELSALIGQPAMERRRSAARPRPGVRNVAPPLGKSN